MCHQGIFSRGDDPFFYEVNPPVAYSAAQIVARDREILIEKPIRLPMMPWDKRMLISLANLIPLMRYLFQALPSTDFHWEHLDAEVFEFIAYCEAYEAGDTEGLAPYYANDQDYKLGITSTPNIDDYFKGIAKELPSDPVVAYVDVFGEWPKGFPPVKEYYLEWYKKLKPGK